MNSIVTTADGSHSLFVPALDEHYHSMNGAIQESRHVFINALNQIPKNHIRILEIGFGTGLNAFLSLLTDRDIHYTALELYPLSVEMACALNYPEMLDTARRTDFEHLHSAGWNKAEVITPHFTLYKINADFTQYKFPEQYDVIYFDAFSPEKQPEMWSETVFEKLYDAAAPNAVLTTYCAKGAVRRAMQQAGFVVERLPGPPGKREMLRAKKVIR